MGRSVTQGYFTSMTTCAAHLTANLKVVHSAGMRSERHYQNTVIIHTHMNIRLISWTKDIRNCLSHIDSHDPLLSAVTETVLAVRTASSSGQEQSARNPLMLPVKAHLTAQVIAPCWSNINTAANTRRIFTFGHLQRYLKKRKEKYFNLSFTS